MRNAAVVVIYSFAKAFVEILFVDMLFQTTQVSVAAVDAILS